MKAPAVVFVASLAANVVLLAFLGRGLLAGSSSDVSAAKPEATAPKPSAPAVAAQAWDELQSADLSVHLERLRTEGFPPSVIRAVAKAQIRARFADRRKALEAADAGSAYWLPDVDPKRQAEQRALAREEQNALKELLGPDPGSGTLAGLRRSLPNVAPDKLVQLAEIRDRQMEQTNEIYSRGSLLPEEAAKIPALEKAANAEIAALLSPAELEEYDLRVSRTANQLRYNLSAFEATEAEFRTLYRLQRGFDDQLGSIQPGASQEQMQARSEAQRRLQEEIKSALGPDRYADYQRATDYNYRRTTQVVERLSLPPETANELYALQKSVQQRVTDVRRNAAPTDRQAQLQAIVTEAEGQIGARIGPSGLEVYKQYAGTWLNNIAPRPSPPATKQ